MTLDKRILDIMKRYMGMLVSKKVLTTMEEVEANTNETNLVAAPVVAELNDKLAGFEPVLDSTGKITGYKTNVGGADTVFPFSDIEGKYYSGTFHAYSTSNSKFNTGGKQPKIIFVCYYSYSNGYSASITDFYDVLHGYRYSKSIKNNALADNGHASGITLSNDGFLWRRVVGISTDTVYMGNGNWWAIV